MSQDGRIEALKTVPAGVTVSVTPSGGSAASVALAAGQYYWTSVGSTAGSLATFSTALAAAVTGGTATLSTGASGTGLITIAATGLFDLTWTSTELRDLMGFTGNLTGANTYTGTYQARGLWRPVLCPMTADQDPRAAPSATDLRTTTSPTGVVYGLFGNRRFRHTNVKWAHVASTQIWIGAETTTHASWEYFFNETQLGLGSSWFTPASRVQVYTHTGDLVGQYANAGAGTSGWWITGVQGVVPKRAVDGWDGMYAIELPELVSDG